MIVGCLDSFSLQDDDPARRNQSGHIQHQMYYLFFFGMFLLGGILVLFWLKDVRQSPQLARLAYSGFVARLALAGAAFTILGVLLILGEWWGSA